MNVLKFYKPNGEVVKIPISQGNQNLYLKHSNPNRQMTMKEAVGAAQAAGLLRRKPKAILAK